jgi:hypothetical protein
MARGTSQTEAIGMIVVVERHGFRVLVGGLENQPVRFHNLNGVLAAAIVAGICSHRGFCPVTGTIAPGIQTTFAVAVDTLPVISPLEVRLGEICIL